MAIKHSAIRAYVFECTYNSVSWIDDPAPLITALQTALNNNMQNFSYKQIKVANVKNASGSKIEVELNGITYTNYGAPSGPNTFSATDNDNLISDLNTALLTLSNMFSFQIINICNDCFLEDPTSGYPGQSFQKDNS